MREASHPENRKPVLAKILKMNTETSSNLELVGPGTEKAPGLRTPCFLPVEPLAGPSPSFSGGESMVWPSLPHSFPGGRKETLFSRVPAPGPSNCKPAFVPLTLNKKAPGKVHLQGREQDTYPKNVPAGREMDGSELPTG